MCDACDLAFAEEVLDAVSGMTFWRPLTSFEKQFGDIPRVARDFERVEMQTAETLQPIVEKMVQQLKDEAVELVKQRDLEGIARLAASYEGPLVKAMRDAAADAVSVGKAQIHDQFREQRAHRFAALPPRKRPKLTKAYLDARASVKGREVSESVTSAARQAALYKASQGEMDEEAIAEAIDDALTTAAEEAILKTSVSTAREGIAVGRYVAIEDTAEYIDRLVYSAINDSNCCDECASWDGQELDLDQADAAPNPNCVGEQYGNACRCVVIVQYTRDARGRVA